MIAGRLKAKEAHILAILKSSEKFGLDVVTESGGEFRRGTVYILLSDMEDRGLLVSRVVNEDGKRAYSLTAGGRAALTEWEAANKPAFPSCVDQWTPGEDEGDIRVGRQAAKGERG